MLEAFWNNEYKRAYFCYAEINCIWLVLAVLLMRYQHPHTFTRLFYTQACSTYIRHIFASLIHFCSPCCSVWFAYLLSHLFMHRIRQLPVRPHIHIHIHTHTHAHAYAYKQHVGDIIVIEVWKAINYSTVICCTRLSILLLRKCVHCVCIMECTWALGAHC